MNKLTINIFILIFLSTFIHSCQGAKDALQGKKRSEQSDEFLVKKKNPLVMPPDYDDLPEPSDDENPDDEEDNIDIQKIIGVYNQDTEINSSESVKSIEDFVLENINKD